MSEHQPDLHKPIIVQEGKRPDFNNNVLVEAVAALAIYSMIVPLLLTDLSITIYQFIFFGVHRIPKISLGEYMVFDRGHLSKLNLWQKINCVYCEYANGIVNWARAVAAQTEIYSCAIK